MPDGIESPGESPEVRALALFERMAEERASVIEELTYGKVDPEALRAYLKENYDPRLLEYLHLIGQISPMQHPPSIIDVMPGMFEEDSEEEVVADALLGTSDDLDEGVKLKLEATAEKGQVLEQISLLRANVLREYYLHGTLPTERATEAFRHLVASISRRFGVDIPETVQFTYPKRGGAGEYEEETRYEEGLIEFAAAAQEEAQLERGVPPTMAAGHGDRTADIARRAIDRYREETQAELASLFAEFPDPKAFVQMLFGLDEAGSLPDELLLQEA